MIFSLRDATPADIPDVFRLTRALAEYERELEHFTATNADFDRFLFGDGPRACAILAVVAGLPPVGLALFNRTISTFQGKTGIFLEDLFVEPEHRGKGIGLALIRQVASRAASEGGHVMEWRVLNWNQPAIDFYEKLGAAPMQKWHVRQLRGAALMALAQGDSQNG